MASHVRSEDVDGVEVISIDNPPVNALATGIREDILVAVRDANQRQDAVAIVLMGAGRTFVGGADLKVFQTLATVEQSIERSTRVHRVLCDIEDSELPVVCAIHGVALGGGLELAMACHYRVATANARVGQPEVKLGLIPGAGGTQRLPRLCGTALAMDLCTTGHYLEAPLAAEHGIVDAIVDGAALKNAAVHWARDNAAHKGRRRTRDLTGPIGDVERALEACAAGRCALDPAGPSAPFAVIDAIEAGLRDGFDAGSIVEIQRFADCVVSDASRTLVQRFFDDRAAARAARAASSQE